MGPPGVRKQLFLHISHAANDYVSKISLLIHFVGSYSGISLGHMYIGWIRLRFVQMYVYRVLVSKYSM